MLSDFISNPIISYIRVGKPYPNFWGESHTHPNLIKWHGCNIDIAIYCYYNKNAYYILDADKASLTYSFLVEKLLSEPKHLKSSLIKTQSAINSVNEIYEEITSNYLYYSEIQTIRYLSKLHRLLFKIQFYADSTYYFGETLLNEKLEQKIEDFVEINSLHKSKNKIKDTITKFDNLTYLEKENYLLSKISLTKNKTDLKKHINNWKHKYYDYWGPEVNDNEFYERLIKFQNNPSETHKKFLEYERYRQHTKEQKYKIISEYKLPKDIQILGNLIAQIGYLNDTKKYGVTKSTYLINCLLKNLANRLQINKDLLNYLKPKEILFLNNGRLPISVSDIEKRTQWYIQIFKNGEIKYSTTDIEIQLSKDVLELIKPVKSVENSLNGIPASKGIHKGIVVKMNSHKDLAKALPNMVLVSPKTTVDFIIAIHKSGSVVTDYGGVTSHSAIIAREENIPCVVATKNATLILNDGDYVEVNGNTGEIKILKKCKVKDRRK